MTEQFFKLTEDQFDTEFTLRKNHLNPHAGWGIGEGPGSLFETYGEELEFVRSFHPRYLWTLVDGDDGDLYIISGFHFVNRIGYFVSFSPTPDGTTIQVRIPQVDTEPTN